MVTKALKVEISLEFDKRQDVLLKPAKQALQPRTDAPLAFVL